MLITALNYRRIIGGTLIGILVVTAIGIPLGLAHYTGIVVGAAVASADFPATRFLARRRGSFLIVIFSFLFVDVFDNAGTLIGVTHRAGLTDAQGNLPRMKQALLADSFAAMFGSLIGTSTTTSYIESAAGVAAGGRTGLTALFVAVFFLAALFFAPLAGMVPAYASAAALLYVACVMARGLAEIDWDDITESAPAVVAAVTMPLTYSIATGIGLGFITYALIKAHRRQVRRGQAGGAGAGAIFASSLLVRASCGPQRLLDRQKIPPGEPLLQRAAQQKGRVERRHGADFARAGVEGEPAPARSRDAFLDAEQRLRRGLAEADQKVGIGELDLAPDERQADRGFLRRRRAVAGRPPRHDVGDVGGGAIEPDRRHHAVEQFAGAADKRQPGDVFVVARALRRRT